MKGSPEIGKLADVAVLDRDPLAVDAEALRGITALMTFVGGIKRYEA